MYALRGIRQVLTDLLDESFLVIATGLLGAVLSLLVVPIPFVMAAHYHTALRLAERRKTTLGDWFRAGRTDLSFFAPWTIQLGLVAASMVAGVLLYLRSETLALRAVSLVALGLLISWLLPQPLAPAFYLRQRDRRFRTALRNAGVLVIVDFPSITVMWLCVGVAILPARYLAWPLALFLAPFLGQLSTQIVKESLRDDAG